MLNCKEQDHTLATIWIQNRTPHNQLKKRKNRHDQKSRRSTAIHLFSVHVYTSFQAELKKMCWQIFETFNINIVNAISCIYIKGDTHNRGIRYDKAPIHMPYTLDITVEVSQISVADCTGIKKINSILRRVSN